MRVCFNLEKHEEVFNKLVGEWGYCEDTFLTDDVIEIDWSKLEKLKDELPAVSFIVDRDSLSLKDRLYEAADKLGWNIIEDDDGGVDFRQGSPAGEDFGFYIHAGDDIVEETIRYAGDFDVDEHIEMWAEAKRGGTSGVPSIRTLVEDADAIQEMLDELAQKFATVQRNFNYNLEDKDDESEEEACDNGCTKILVVVKGGMVQEVYCTDMNAEVCIEDLDTTEGTSEDSLGDGRWLDGTTINKENMTLLY